MSEFLTNMLAANLIDKLDGDDDRFAKMEKAAEALTHDFQENPETLIRAILVALDPDIPSDDPTILLAEQALLDEWKSMNSVHTNKPIGILRSILLDACHQAAEGNNAAIIWLTAADTLPLMHLGKEEQEVRKILQEIAIRTEKIATEIPKMPTKQRKTPPKESSDDGEITVRKVNRANLLTKVSAAAGPNNKQGQANPNPNPHWCNAHQAWTHEFSDRMSALLANELDNLAADINELDQKKIESLSETLNSQRLWMQNAIKSNIASFDTERTRINALWWSEALYSSSLRCSYRELPPELASIVMAIDLTDVISQPTPASIGYLLAEAVNRLPNSGFEQSYSLHKFLNALREARNQIPEKWFDDLISSPDEGRLSMRDLFIHTLTANEWDIEDAMKRTGLNNDIKMSIPEISHAIFRQEQAVQLAGNN